MEHVQVVALYNFVPVTDPAALRGDLYEVCASLQLKGTLLVAPEGINGTLAGSRVSVDGFLQLLGERSLSNGMEVKFATAAEPPFLRLKVRLKKEIVTLGIAGLDPSSERGEYVEPDRWNALIEEPDTVLIDTRNDYEVKLGTFQGALNPATERFGELPAWVDEHLDMPRDTPIAMFCTGGIRCEKSTALLRSRGFTNVHHLKGGILRYLAEVPAEESRWLGECFVFDERVSVGTALAPTDTVLCRGCQMPVTAAEQAMPGFVEGVSCPSCVAVLSDAQKERFTNRQRQTERAKALGSQHVAADLSAERARKRREREVARARSKDS